MKISKVQLQQIIQEELAGVLDELEMLDEDDRRQEPETVLGKLARAAGKFPMELYQSLPVRVQLDPEKSAAKKEEAAEIEAAKKEETKE